MAIFLNPLIQFEKKKNNKMKIKPLSQCNANVTDVM